MSRVATVGEIDSSIKKDKLKLITHHETTIWLEYKEESQVGTQRAHKTRRAAKLLPVTH